MKVLVFTLLLAVSLPAFSGSSFDRKIYEIQVLEDQIRLNVGGTYGTCGDVDGRQVMRGIKIGCLLR